MNNLSIVIPHHNRADMLKECLSRIPLEIPTYVIRSGTYAENCNKGFTLCNTDYVMFLNDDCFLNEDTISKMMALAGEYNIVGVSTFSPGMDKAIKGIQIFPYDQSWPFREVEKIEDVHFPAGACWLIDHDAFVWLEEFNESYKSGGEDVELFLKAIKANYQFKYVRKPIQHVYAQSEGRFKHVRENVKLLLDKFPIHELEKIKERLEK